MGSSAARRARPAERSIGNRVEVPDGTAAVNAESPHVQRKLATGATWEGNAGSQEAQVRRPAGAFCSSGAHGIWVPAPQRRNTAAGMCSYISAAVF